MSSRLSSQPRLSSPATCRVPFCLPGTGTAVLVAVLARAWLAAAAAGQDLVRADLDTGARAHAHSAVPADLAALCAGGPRQEDAVLGAVVDALALPDREAARRVLAALEPDARREAERRPEDFATQYRLAAVLGARAETEGGRAKVSAARDLDVQLARLLDLEPGHAGASHMLGRLHAAVLRLDRVTRFLATRLVGARALEGASWESAQALLEVAEREEPCVPDHHYELARLYGERGDAEAAERERAHVLELTVGSEGRWATLRERAERLGVGKAGG